MSHRRPQPRATIKALPTTPNRPRPYGLPGLLPDFPAEVDVYEGRSIGCGRDKSAPYGCPEYFVNVHNWAPSCYAYRMVARRFALLCAGHEYLSVRFYQLRHVP